MKNTSSFVIAILFLFSLISAQELKYVSAGDKPAFTSIEVIGSKGSKGAIISKYDKNGLVGSYIKYSSHKAKEAFKTSNGEPINISKVKIDTSKFYEIFQNEKGVWTLTGKLVDVKTFTLDSKNVHSDTLQSENTTKATVKHGPPEIIIKGRFIFTTIHFYKTHTSYTFDARSCLRLYDKNKPMELGLDGNDITFLGQIASTSVDADGNFSFHISKSGAYLLFACLDAKCSLILPQPVYRNSNPIVIEIPENGPFPYTYDCGKVNVNENL